MTAISAGKRGKNVLVLDHANKAGKKILMSGGGRCNFTNLDIQPENYLGSNPHFHKSALSRYTQWDFISLVEKHNIPYHEKTLGQLFCDNKSKDILEMLLSECEDVQSKIRLNCNVLEVVKTDNQFELKTSLGLFTCESLVIATGGLSIPKMGASGFGYEIAKQFGHTVMPTSAALVPFTITDQLKQFLNELSGTSQDVSVTCNGQSFRENMLFTHRGLSGPAILQISSYWNSGDTIEINLLPDEDVLAFAENSSNKSLEQILNQLFSKKLSTILCELFFNQIRSKNFAEISKQKKAEIHQQIHHWQIKPNGTEGYRTAEVTKGGVNTDEVSSKTFESKLVKGLFFVGEVLDVTGHLGGYNFQWAWSSGHACGQFV